MVLKAQSFVAAVEVRAPGFAMANCSNELVIMIFMVFSATSVKLKRSQSSSFCFWAAPVKKKPPLVVFEKATSQGQESKSGRLCDNIAGSDKLQTS